MKISSNDKTQISIHQKKQDVPITFCFKHLTTNKKYRVRDIRDYRKKCNAYEKLFEKINEIQNCPWKDFGIRKKQQGLECISFEQLNFSATNLTEELKDVSKFISIRFCSGKYIIIAIKAPERPVLHIIGFDLNFNAYDHGN